MVISLINKFNKNIGLLSLVILLLVICFLPHITIWDEEWYMRCVTYIDNYGFTRDFILNDPAAPMHAIIYYLLRPITHGNVIGTRLINLAMCVAICWVVYKTVKLITPNSKDTFSYSLMLFAIPSFFVLGFFAITEAPCLLFYSLSVYLFFKAYIEGKYLFLVLISGIFFGFAVITRQLFLLCLAPPAILFLYKRKVKSAITILLFFLSSILVCGPIFYIWKDIVPPNSGAHHGIHDLLTFKHWFLSFGYSFFYFLCIIPVYLYNFFKEHKKWVLPLIALGVIFSFLVKNAEFLPISGLLPRLFPEKVIYIIAHLYFVSTCILACFLIFFFFHELKNNLHDFVQVFLILSMFIILCTPLFLVSMFSSRYPLQSAPLMLVFCSSRLRPVNPKLQAAIFATTIVINLISVVTFFD